MGTLYIVATPIGNLKDITFRAIESLKQVDFILCEDTRQSIKLLNHYEISKPLISYFQHSKISKINYILEQLEENKDLALITDAGTPGISDPGNKLIEEIVKQLPSCKIVPIPGPSALITALSISGFPTDKFFFMGFPPAKKSRGKYFQKVLEIEYPVVFYESPYRILKTLNQLELIISESIFTIQAIVCRELTKKFETIYRGEISEIVNQLKTDKKQTKGEFVVIIWKSPKK
ncbi:16S rRNA (cytidine(1402)-2'-O)-methyltransferase [Candidatus Wolfebacteria bacterium]|nr:16S rRNA (cytidine(1402)-2'-O)-methyltransferase [Candidatus Wolfebacteria bacterium]